MVKIKSVSIAAKPKIARSHNETMDPGGAERESSNNALHSGEKTSSLPPRISRLGAIGAFYNWSTWIFIMVMIFSQFLGVAWNTVETHQYVIKGKDPSLGPVTLDGSFNGEPFMDRAVACVGEGRYYKPVQLTEAVSTASGYLQVVDTTGTSINGYRLIQRQGLTMTSAARDVYSDVCALIATTMDSIFDACTELGYNVTQDNLRVVDGLDSSTTYLIHDSLPVVILPLTDNAQESRFAIPGWDGHACMFRLMGKYLDKTKSLGIFRGVNRAIREAKTVEWLARPGGNWKNGWYEDQQAEKWHTDVISTGQKSIYGISQRQFDTMKRKEIDCINTEDCRDLPVVEDWGAKFSTTDQALAINSIFISNGNNKGLFLYELRQHRIIKSIYDWETLISNTSLMLLLVRWMLAMYALQRGYLLGESKWYNAGLGSLASSRSFNMLPIVLLPRLKITLSAFWSVGCAFGGDQKALSEAWFVVYPAILELMLLQFSLLNIISKILRRRIPDAPFGPSVILFCILHWLRMEFADRGTFGITENVTPLLTSTEFEELRLVDFFTTKAPFKLNGNVSGLIAIKLVVLGLNFVPLLLMKTSTTSLSRSPDDGDIGKATGIEKALAVRVCKIGGLGRSVTDEYADDDSSQAAAVADTSKKNDGAAASNRMEVNSYELVRLGYLVYGGKYLLSFEDWEGLALMAPFHRFYYLWNNRVALFTLRDEREQQPDGSSLDIKAVSEKPHMCRLDDPKLEQISCWDIIGRPIK
uniref:Uncharacterized protein n=1 Tax=Globisporangium ultimum (strain ATCC 200006 / CBS 805.95 / DAOM BR144) TaxID=431595 RepID=K3WCJ0_GLOUD